MATWTESHLRPAWDVAPKGWVIGLLAYEALVGVSVPSLGPVVGSLLTVAPLVYFLFLARPYLAYGAFIVSIQFSDIALTRVGLYNLRTVDVFFAVLLVTFVVRTLSEPGPLAQKTGIDSALWLFLAWVGLSVVWSMDRIMAIEALIKIAIGVATFYMTVRLISDQHRLEIAANTWVIAGVISALVAMYEWQTVAMPHLQADATKWATAVRSQAFYGGPIMLGAFLTLAICVSYAQILNARSGLAAAVHTSACGLMVVALLTTLSRNDIAAFTLATVLFTYRFPRMRAPMAGLIGLVLLMGVVFTGGQLFVVVWERLIFVAQGLEVSSPARATIWKLALDTIRQHPIIGLGVASFPTVAEQVQAHGLSYPHSMILYVLAEFGAIGFLLATYLAIRIYQAVRAAEKTITNESQKALATAAAAGFLVHLVWSLAQNITFQHIIFWAFLGLAFAIYRVLPQARQAEAG